LYTICLANKKESYINLRIFRLRNLLPNSSLAVIMGKYVGIGAGLGICFGAIFGVIYGKMVEDIGFWIAIGVGIGISFGAGIGTRLDAKAKKKN